VAEPAPPAAEEPAAKENGPSATFGMPAACGPVGLLAPLAVALGLFGLRRTR
jgi:hypothetical protein